MKKIYVFPLLFFLFFFHFDEAKALISRSVGDMELGMGIEDFRKRFFNEEVTDSLALLKGDRVFSIKRRTENIEMVVNSFYDGKLYKIEVNYSLPYSNQVPWKVFVSGAIGELGNGKQLETTKGPIIMWGDEESSLKMEKRPLKGGQFRYVLSLLDNAIFLSRGEKCSSRPFKV